MGLPRMEYREIVNKHTGEKLIGFVDEDFEQADPIRYYKDAYIIQNMILRGIPIAELQQQIPITNHGKQIFKAALNSWSQRAKEISATNIPEILLQLLDKTIKRDQEKLLRGFALTPEILIAFI